MENSVWSAAAVVAFWTKAGPGRWFKKDALFDDEFRVRFAAEHQAAASGALDHWANTADGTLALLILLDQYPRNSFRGTASMFATDAKALTIAKAAIALGFDVAVDPALRSFMYLPFMHSEALPEQDRALELYAALGSDSQRFAVLHRDIIVRFGRFPHRNALLGRATTAEEQAFLDAGGFTG
jgi:uncharacterized protein (DUF924 family)